MLNYTLDKRIRELQNIYDIMHTPKGKEIFKDCGLPANPEYEDFIAVAESESEYNTLINRKENNYGKTGNNHP